MHAEYLDGFLEGEIASACEAHLDACSACLQHDVQIRRSLMALQALPVIEPSADFRARLWERIGHEGEEPLPVRPHGIRWGIAAAVLAASLALLVAAPTVRTGVSRAAKLFDPGILLMAQRGAAVTPDYLSRRAIPTRALAADLPTSIATAPLFVSVSQQEPALTLPAEPMQGAKSRSPRASTQGRSTARFEALSGQAPLRTAAPPPHSSAMRVQTVTFIGQ